MVTKLDHRLALFIPLLAVACIAGWLLMPSRAQTTQPDLALNLAAAAPPEDLPAPDAATIDSVDLARISLSRQSFRRGGLGSQALMSFTLRNANDYGVKDIELVCAFRSRDGAYVTERRKLLDQTIAMKSRKAIARTLIGHINVRASQAKCAPVMASRA